MKGAKSERLRKLESELADLEQWLKLGLVPKKDISKHKEEIALVQSRIDEEKERLHFLKESGELEEYVAPKRPASRNAFNELPTFPEIDASESEQDSSAEIETDEAEADDESMLSEGDDDGSTEADDTEHESNDDEEDDEDEESYFSDRNRWKRGGIIDPDADEW